MSVKQRLFLVKRAAGDAPDLERATFIASTAASDRYGDVVDQSWLLDNYRANPVIQVDHDYRADATVGRATSAEVKDGALVIEVQWGKGPRAQEVAQKVADGLLSAVSVGFRPGRSARRSEFPVEHPYYADKVENPYGMAYYDNELLEVSVVAVPANPEALAQRSFGGLTTEDHDAIAERVTQRLISAGVLAQRTCDPVSPVSATSTLANWLNGAK
jgi:HK97 family phage prohead protease